MASDLKDSRWLDASAAERSDQAFRALVERHIGLVYSTALRQVGDRALAEEVTQNVFIALARKPQDFRRESTLAGWLYKAALLQARQCIRSELRRKRREETAVELGTVGANPDSIWEPLVPLLDEALLNLRETDRLAVVLRFLEAKPFREVGTVLGVSEDAAQKRVAKALDVLTNFFRRHGFIIPALTLTTPLLKEAAKAAPAGLAAAITRVAVRQAAIAPSSGAALLGMKPGMFAKFGTAVACLVVGIIPVVMGWRSLDKARMEYETINGTLQAAVADLTDAQARQTFLARQKAALEEMLTTLKKSTFDQNKRHQIVPRSGEENYTWFDASDYVRVPKAYLEMISIPTFESTNGSMKLRDEFSALLGLSPSEAAKINESFAEVWQQYRIVEDKHTQPIEVPAIMLERFSRFGANMEVVSYRREAFPEEGATWQERLDGLLSPVLGAGRKNFFWHHAQAYFGGFRLDWGQNEQRLTFYASSHPSPQRKVQFEIDTLNAISFYTLEPYQDVFAPESFQPILRRWRSAITQNGNQTE